MHVTGTKLEDGLAVITQQQTQGLGIIFVSASYLFVVRAEKL